MTGRSTPRFVNLLEICKGIRVEEVLRDGRIRTRFDLGQKGLQVRFGVSGLRMHLRIRGHFDVEIAAEFVANKRHQITGVVELAAQAIAAGQVTAQGHQALDAHVLELLELRAHRLLGGTHTKCDAASNPSSGSP